MPARIGPEILTAASDNDLTNVGTAVLVGARTGYQLSWVALLVAPLLAVVVAIAAHVGIAAGTDLQSLIRVHYGRGLARTALILVVVVNLATMTADLQAGAAGLGLLAGASPGWFVLPLGLVLAGLLLIGKYDAIVAVLRYVLVGFLAFGAAAVLAHPDWARVLRDSATLGQHPRAAVTVTAAAGTLRPLAGSLAADVFAVGLVTSAVVALPVLMATTAYVVGAEFDWHRGLSAGVVRARGFYAVLVASVVLAATVDLAGITLLDMLAAASVIGGLGTPVPMILLVRLARHPAAMRGNVISARLAVAGWVIAIGLGGLGLVWLIAGLLGVL
jgi:Mn2+/Fe2+ NRAMP family transporter